MRKWRLVNDKNLPDGQDQACECRKEAANTKRNWSCQNKQEKCVKERRDSEKKKKRAPVGI